MKERRYNWITHNSKSALEHVVIASKALGRPLPEGARVHHVDGNGKNNVTTNLVICPSAAYHDLIHIRKRAVDAGCPAHWRKCHFCQTFSDPEQMSQVWLKGKFARFEHGACANAYQRDRMKRVRAAA